MLSASGRPLLTVALILDRTADWYRVPRDLIRSRRRAARFARPRQVAVWLAAQLLPSRSLPRLGRDFCRDHTTVLHAITMVDYRRRDPAFAADLDELRQAIVAEAEPASAPVELAVRVAEDLAEAFRQASLAYAAKDPAGFVEKFITRLPKEPPHA